MKYEGGCATLARSFFLLPGFSGSCARIPDLCGRARELFAFFVSRLATRFDLETFANAYFMGF